MKSKLTTLFFKSALAGLVAAAMTFGSAGKVGAQAPSGTCGLTSLSGTYAFATHGYNVVSGVPVPKANVETLQFNGDGRVAPFATVSINGTSSTIAVPPEPILSTRIAPAASPFRPVPPLTSLLAAVETSFG